MDYQTSQPYLNDGGQQKHGAQALLALAVDVLKLADLQVQLLTLDVREVWAAAWKSVLVLGGGMALVIAAMPVLLISAGEYLRQAFSLSQEFALLLVSGVVLAVATALIGWSAQRLARAAKPLRRSTDELRANMTWLRSVLHSDAAAEAAARETQSALKV